MADSVRYPLATKSDVNRARLLDRAKHIAEGPTVSENEHGLPNTSVIDIALQHYIESFDNMMEMKEDGYIPGPDERERWQTAELRFALYPKIRTKRGSHQ